MNTVPSTPLSQQKLLTASNNVLEVELSAYHYVALSLFPVYVGDTLQLRIRYHIRQFIRIIMPQIIFVFVALVSVLILSLWFALKKRQRIFVDGRNRLLHVGPMP